jgi:hypothetical protein
MQVSHRSLARTIARERIALIARWSCLLALAPLTACSSMTRGPLVAIDKTAGSYNEVNLVYEVPFGKVGLGPVVPRYEGQVVSYQPLPSPPPGTRCGAKLEVDYPHPDGRKDVGRVQVTIRTARTRGGAATTAATATAPGVATEPQGFSFTETMESIPVVGDMLVTGPKSEERWEWDAPKSEIDRVLTDLAYHGYFDRLDLPDMVADVDARVDGRRVARSWQRIPSFEAFMQAARQQGRLVAYKSSDESPVPGVDGSTAVVALNRQINTRAGGRTVLQPGVAPSPPQAIATTLPAQVPGAAPASYVNTSGYPSTAPAAYAPQSPGYAAAPNTYGALPPSYGTPPSYGSPAPSYGSAPATYGAPPQANVAQQPYGAPTLR